MGIPSRRVQPPYFCIANCGEHHLTSRLRTLVDAYRMGSVFEHEMIDRLG